MNELGWNGQEWTSRIADVRRPRQLRRQMISDNPADVNRALSEFSQVQLVQPVQLLSGTNL